MQAAKQLCGCLARCKPVAIHAELTVTPADHLHAAAKATFQYLLVQFAFPAKVRSMPLCLTRWLLRILGALYWLFVHCYTKQELLTSFWRTRLSRESVMPDQELARPSDLAQDIGGLLAIYASLEEATGAELSWLAREVCERPISLTP